MAGILLSLAGKTGDSSAKMRQKRQELAARKAKNQPSKVNCCFFLTIQVAHC
jgi:hypothetical protein